MKPVTLMERMEAAEENIKRIEKVVEDLYIKIKKLTLKERDEKPINGLGPRYFGS